MRTSKRLSRSEAHFYIQKLLQIGFRKIMKRDLHEGYEVLFERTLNGSKEVLIVRYMNNGWVSFIK